MTDDQRSPFKSSAEAGAADASTPAEPLPPPTRWEAALRSAARVLYDLSTPLPEELLPKVGPQCS